MAADMNIYILKKAAGGRLGRRDRTINRPVSADEFSHLLTHMADNLGISETISREQQQHGIENVIILIFRDSRTMKKIDQFDDRHVCHNVLLLLPSINQNV